ncbi:MAG: RICIN domain-containing protein [Clostridia bacterium]|nr:RICIN domain-containing protein [Clostridia bacterium]
MISAAKVEQKQHVNRLREQETGLNSIMFQNRNGGKTEYIFNSPVKYVAEDGSIKDIRTQPTAGKYAVLGRSYAYAVTEHSMPQYFPAQLGMGALMEIGGRYVEMTPISTYVSLTVKNAKLQGKSVLYEDVFAAGTDVKYTPTADGIKEDIILDSYIGTSSFAFLLKTDGLAIVERGDGFCFVGADDATLASLGEVVVYDSEGKHSMGNMTVEEVEPYEVYRVTLHADEAFLRSPDTVYPVTVDPRIFEKDYDYYGNDVHTILDYGLYSSVIPSTSDSYHYLGKQSNGTLGRVLYKLPLFVENGCALSINYTRYTREEIGSVTLHVYGSGSSAGSFKVYPITQSWVSETNALVDSTLWNACTASSQYVAVSASTLNGYNSFDITEIVRGWADYNHDVSGATLNPAYGIALVNDNETSTAGRWSLYTVENTQNNVYAEFDYALTAGNQVRFSNRSTGKFIKRTSDTTLSAKVYESGDAMTWIVQYHGDGIYTICDMNGRPLYMTSTGTLQIGAAPATWTDYYRWQFATSSYGGLIVKNIATGMVLYHASNSSTVTTVASKTTSDADYWNTCWGVAPTYTPLEDFSIPEELLYLYYNNAVQTVQLRIEADGGEDDWTSNRDFTWSVSNSTFSVTSSYSSSGLLTTYQYGGVTNITVTHKTTGLTRTFRFVCSVLREDVDYYFENKQYGLFMEVEGPSTANGALVQQWELHAGNHARFRVEMSSPSTFYIRSAYSEKYLQVQNASTASGAKIEQSSYSGEACQRWVVTKTTSGALRIAPALTHSNGYGLRAPAQSNGADLEQYSYTSNSNYNDEWNAKPYEFSVNVGIYFDYSVVDRYGNGEAESIYEMLEAVFQNAEERTLSYWNLSLNTTHPEFYETITDKCSKSGEFTWFVDENGYHVMQGGLCPDHPRVKEETGYENNICIYHGESGNCTNQQTAFLDFYNNHPGNTTTVNIIFSANTYFEETGEEDIRSFSWYYGISIIENNFLTRFDYQDGAHRSLIHELAHQIGARDHYHNSDGPDSSCTNSEYCNECNGINKRPSQCIMDNQNSDTVCDECQIEILTHLLDHH